MAVHVLFLVWRRFSGAFRVGAVVEVLLVLRGFWEAASGGCGVVGAWPAVTSTERDQVADELTKPVAHLIRKRDAGIPGRSLAEQRPHREGFTAAIRAVASSALLVAMLQEPGAR